MARRRYDAEDDDYELEIERERQAGATRRARMWMGFVLKLIVIPLLVIFVLAAGFFGCCMCAGAMH